MTSDDLIKIKNNISEFIEKFDFEIKKINEFVGLFKSNALNLKTIKKRKHFPFSEYMKNDFNDEITEYSLNKIRIHFGRTKLNSNINKKNHSVLNNNVEYPHSYSLMDGGPEFHKKLLLTELDCIINRIKYFKFNIKPLTRVIDDILNQNPVNMQDLKALNIYKNDKKNKDEFYNVLCSQVLDKTYDFYETYKIKFQRVYYINHVPPGSFVDKKGGKVKIANCYIVAYKDEKWNIFFDYYEPFTLSQYGYYEKKSDMIKKFNESNNANINNVCNIILNNNEIITSYNTSKITSQTY